MFDVRNPHIKCIEEQDVPSHGKFAMELLNQRHGAILGNLLQRILLSSFLGSAVTSIKIDGVQHEFTTIPDVKEDVTESVLNVKGFWLSCTVLVRGRSALKRLEDMWLQPVILKRTLI